MDERHAEVAGMRMRWLERGEDGPAVVLVHGIPTSPTLWRRVLPLLERVRALAWEMPGYGRSWAEGRDRDISLAAQADHLAAFVDALELDRPVLVGHDLGGGVAQIAAVRRPDRYGGLVLVNAVSYDSWPIPSVKALRAGAPALAKLPPLALVPVFVTLMARGHDDRRLALEAMRLHRRPYDHREGAAAFARQVRSLRAEDTLAVAPALRGLELPARVVWGAADQFQELEYGRRLARDLGAEIDEISGGKHFVPEDHPARVAGAVRRLVGPAHARRPRVSEPGRRPATRR